LDPPYDIKLVFVQKTTFVLRKINKTAAIRTALLNPICTKSFVGWGFALTPLGSVQCSPEPLAVLGAKRQR